MKRLFLVDQAGGSLAALGAAMAGVEGAPGFDEVLARSSVDPSVDPLIGAALAEVGILLVPPVAVFDERERHEGDAMVSIGPAAVPGADAVFSLALAPDTSPGLVRRSTARRMRDGIARNLAEFCALRASGRAG